MKAIFKFGLIVLIMNSIFLLNSLTFDDIQYWVGEGENQAAIVIDWTDNLEPYALAWGFRWDGEATGADMLSAIVNADPRLSGDIEMPTSLFYDLNNDGVIDENDHQRTAYWNAGNYWPYFIGTDGENWTYASEAFNGRTLSDGDWDGWAFCEDWQTDNPIPRFPSPAEPPITIEDDIAFEDITYWIGEGENQAILTIDFNDATSDESESFAWGYRWNDAESVTGQTILEAIDEADDRLSIVFNNGFLSDITFEYNEVMHSGIGGDPDYWGTWSKTEDTNWEMNNGVNSEINNLERFGCSYGFNPAPTAPDFPVAVEEPTSSELIANNDIINVRNDLNSEILILANDVFDLEQLQSIEIVENPQYGNITITNDNTIIFEPETTEVISDELTYKILSINNSESNIATVTINIFSPFAPSADQAGSTAIHMDDESIINWATGITLNRGYVNIQNPDEGFASYGEEENALGNADGDSFNVVSLGDGGSAILTFDHPIRNGEGYDFLVFENGFNDYALELAFVEVSSDGENYVRFPSISLTQPYTQVGAFDSLFAENLHNFAGKYRQGYGTPFDLEELAGSDVDINHITHIKIVDVVGSINPEFANYDSYGFIINEPFPTGFESSGFDLDAVGVIHDTSEVGNNDDVNIAYNIKPYNFPNPIKIASNKKGLATTIKFYLPKEDYISVKVFNSKGQKVNTLLENNLHKGEQSVGWNGLDENGNSVSSGVYFYQISGKSTSQKGKMLIIK